MANNINYLEDVSSIGNPLFNSTPKKSSSIERHNQSVGPFGQGLISDSQNVSLRGYTGTVHLNILTDTTTEDLKEIERLVNKLQEGQLKLEAITALNETLKKKQADLQEKIAPLDTQVAAQEIEVRNIKRKYKNLQSRYDYDLEVLGLTDPDEAEEYLGTIKKFSPALNKLAELCENQETTILSLYEKMEELTTEKQNYSWRNVAQKEKKLYDDTEKQIEILNNYFDKAWDVIEEQTTIHNELREELDLVNEENNKLYDYANYMKLHKMCEDLDIKLKSLVKSNEDMKKQNAELEALPRNARLAAPRTTSTVPTTQPDATQTTDELRNRRLDLHSQLNGESIGTTTIIDNDKTLTPGTPKAQDYGAVMTGLSRQVQGVKKEVQGMKEVLKQSKQALKDMLPPAQTTGAIKILNKSADSPSVRLQKNKKRLNKTY